MATPSIENALSSRSSTSSHPRHRAADRPATSGRAEGVRAVGAPRVPDQFNFAADVVYRRAAQDPDAVATIAMAADGSVEAWTFRRVADASRRLAGVMASCGLRRGDRVLLVMARTPHWQVALVACMHLGVVPVPCVTQSTAAELVYRARRSGAAGVMTERGFVDRFDDGAPAIRIARGGVPAGSIRSTPRSRTRRCRSTGRPATRRR